MRPGTATTQLLDHARQAQAAHDAMAQAARDVAAAAEKTRPKPAAQTGQQANDHQG